MLSSILIVLFLLPPEQKTPRSKRNDADPLKVQFLRGTQGRATAEDIANRSGRTPGRLHGHQFIGGLPWKTDLGGLEVKMIDDFWECVEVKKIRIIVFCFVLLVLESCV